MTPEPRPYFTAQRPYPGMEDDLAREWRAMRKAEAVAPVTATRDPVRQERVLALLEKARGPMTADQLAEKFGTSAEQIRATLSRMVKAGSVVTQHVPGLRAVGWIVGDGREDLRQRIVDLMADGRERTADDIANRLGVSRDAAIQAAGMLCRAGMVRRIDSRDVALTRYIAGRDRRLSDAETTATILRMRAEGATYLDIAKCVGLSADGCRKQYERAQKRGYAAGKAASAPTTAETPFRSSRVPRSASEGKP